MIKRLCFFLFYFFTGLQVTALQAATIVDNWRAIQAAYFNEKHVFMLDEDSIYGQSTSKQIEIEAPAQAEDASLVPFSFKVHLKQADIEKIYLFTDANPILLTATFNVTQPSKNFSVATRIRLEKNSIVRVIVQTTLRELLMSTVGIKTPGGGCGGGGVADETALRASAGQMKLRFHQENSINNDFFSFYIKHPMRTGFERTPQGYYAKAWFINRLDFISNDKNFLTIDVGPGISADPYFKLMLPSASLSPIEVNASDNEGKTFQQKFIF